MAIDGSTLRLVSASGAGQPGQAALPLEAALRLLDSDRGALVWRTPGLTTVQLTSCNLSPEEQAACREHARQLWRRSPRVSANPARLGGSTLIAQPLELAQTAETSDGGYVLVAVIRGGGGKVDTDRLARLRDVATLLSAALQGGLVSEQAAAVAYAEMARADRDARRHCALQQLADNDDPAAACNELLGFLLSELPGVEYGVIGLREPGKEHVRLVAAVGFADNQELDAFLSRSGVSGISASGARPVNAGESEETGGAVRTLASPNRRKTARAKLGKLLPMEMVLQVPLRSRGVLIGVLALGARATRELTSDERTFVEALVGPLGGLLDAVLQAQAAEAERERLRTLIETLPMGAVLYEAGGHVALWNGAAETLLGSRPADVQQTGRKGLPVLATPDGRAVSFEDSPLLQALMHGRATVAQEMLLRRPAGETDVPVLVTVAPIRDSQGRSGGVIAVYQDITRLREVDRLKDDFINTVSHELRTPTTTVRGGALTMLKRGDQLGPSVRRQILQDMADEAERLYHLVEDLLSLSRAQAGMRLQPEPIIVSRFVNKVILDLGGRVGNHALTVDVPGDLPLVEADPTYFEQVLRNLLENAVKFSPKRQRIEISAEARGHDILFSVLDRGSGIPAADMDRVFEPFYRTEETVRTGQQGAGLGLAVSRRLIEIMGGTIWAERRGGGGTAFRFTLPALAETED